MVGLLVAGQLRVNCCTNKDRVTAGLDVSIKVLLCRLCMSPTVCHHTTVTTANNLRKAPLFCSFQWGSVVWVSLSIVHLWACCKHGVRSGQIFFSVHYLQALAKGVQTILMAARWPDNSFCIFHNIRLLLWWLSCVGNSDDEIQERLVL